MESDQDQKKKHKWGLARVQFISLQDDIERMLIAGHPKKVIYRELVSQEKITMSYCRFCQFIDQRFDQRFTNKRSTKKKYVPVSERQSQGVEKYTKETVPKTEGAKPHEEQQKAAKPFGRREKGQPYNQNI